MLENARIGHEQQMEASRQEHELRMKQFEIQTKADADREKSQLDNATRIEVAQISAGNAIDLASIAAQQAAAQEVAAEVTDEPKEDPMEKVAVMHGQTLGAIQSLVEQMAKPKQIIRGPDGKAVGVA
jgi:hypothetical protein